MPTEPTKEVHVLTIKLLKTSKFTRQERVYIATFLSKEGYLVDMDGPFLKEEE